MMNKNMAILKVFLILILLFQFLASKKIIEFVTKKIKILAIMGNFPPKKRLMNTNRNVFGVTFRIFSLCFNR